MLNNPLVTIYIPTYNRVTLLKRAVASVLKQSYKNIEIIIVDDCSSDDTLEYLKEITNKYKFVKYYQNEKNSGACVSRNKAIAVANGYFITGLDDDDYFLETRIEDFVNFWNNKSSETICLFTNLYIKEREDQYDKFKEIKKPKIVIQKELLITNWIGNQIFVETAYLKNILFDEKLHMWQDLDCWYRTLNNKVASNIGKATYILDTSHPHERISSKKIQKVYDTFNYLVDKYSLNQHESSILEGQIYSYDLDSLTLKKVLKLSLNNQNKKAKWLLFKKFIKKHI